MMVTLACSGDCCFNQLLIRVPYHHTMDVAVSILTAMRVLINPGVVDASSTGQLSPRDRLALP